MGIEDHEVNLITNIQTHKGAFLAVPGIQPTFILKKFLPWDHKSKILDSVGNRKGGRGP